MELYWEKCPHHEKITKHIDNVIGYASYRCIGGNVGIGIRTDVGRTIDECTNDKHVNWEMERACKKYCQYAKLSKESQEESQNEPGIENRKRMLL